MQFWMRSVTIFLLTTTMGCSSGSGSGGDGADETVDGDPANGQILYSNSINGKDTCLSCHDADGSGTLGQGINIQNVSISRARSFITNGSGIMPIFGPDLTDQEIDDLISYVLTL